MPTSNTLLLTLYTPMQPSAQAAKATAGRSDSDSGEITAP
jgi:hypothetical protein